MKLTNLEFMEELMAQFKTVKKLRKKFPEFSKKSAKMILRYRKLNSECLRRLFQTKELNRENALLLTYLEEEQQLAVLEQACTMNSRTFFDLVKDKYY